MRLTMIALFAVLGGLAACSSSTQPGASIRGTYQLTAVNGQALPATAQSGGYTFTWARGTLTVGDRTYSWYGCALGGAGESQCGLGYYAMTGDGTWRFVSGGLLFQPNVVGATADTVTVSGNTLTVPYTLSLPYSPSFQFTFTKP